MRAIYAVQLGQSDLYSARTLGFWAVACDYVVCVGGGGGSECGVATNRCVCGRQDMIASLWQQAGCHAR